MVDYACYNDIINARIMNMSYKKCKIQEGSDGKPGI